MGGVQLAHTPRSPITRCEHKTCRDQGRTADFSTEMGDKDNLKQMVQEVFKEMIPEIVAHVAAASSTPSGSGTADTGAKKGAAEELNHGKL